MTAENKQFAESVLLNVLKSKTLAKYTAIINSGKIQEGEIVSLRSFMGKSKAAAKAIFEVWDKAGWNELELSQDQQQKGVSWLIDQWKTPRGVERKNNPFGYREQEILENFSHCTLSSLYNAGNQYVDFYLPVYSVYSKDGNGFEYYMQGGQVHIIG